MDVVLSLSCPVGDDVNQTHGQTDASVGMICVSQKVWITTLPARYRFIIVVAFATI